MRKPQVDTLGTVVFATDTQGNMAARIHTTAGTQYQIIQIRNNVRFAIKTATTWTELDTFNYAEFWRSNVGDTRPWNQSFPTMIDQFIKDINDSVTFP